jgi:zinc transport system ATP-binding protein
MLHAHNISFVSNEKQVFSNICLQLKSNDIVSIVGVNGSGKSVFLKIISGIIKQSSGVVSVDNGIKISYMPQKIFISQHLPITVADFFALRTNILNHDLLNKLGIGLDFLAKDLHSVSGGQMQKILFAATIMSNSDIIILDEPEQNLDASSKIVLYELIMEYAVNKAVIIASHDPNIVFKKSNKVLHFDICGAVHYENIHDLHNHKIDAKVKDLFEGYFACKHE